MDTTRNNVDPAAAAALQATAERVIANPPKKSKVAFLKERRAVILARIQQIEARESLKARKNEARRLILIGRCVEEMATRSIEFRAKLSAELDAFVKRPQDRAALGLREKS